MKLPHRYLMHFCAALAATVALFTLPACWLRFCAYEPDKVVVTVLENSGFSFGMTRPGNAPESEFVAFGNQFRGKVQADVGGGKREMFSVRTFSMRAMDVRADPENCAFVISFDEGRRDSVLVKEIWFEKNGHFVFAIKGGAIADAYEISGADATSLPGGIMIKSVSNRVTLSPKHGFGTRWKFRANARGNNRIKLSFLLIMAFSLGFAAIAPFMRKTHPLSRGHILNSLAVALCAAFLLAVVIPLTSYLANRGADAFEFPVSALLPELCGGFLAGSIALFAVFVVSAPVMGDLPVLAVAAFTVYEYLETGILSADFPTLAGGTSFFDSFVRQAADFGVLCALLAAFVFAANRVRPVLRWVMAGTFVMTCASMLDVRKSDAVGASSLEDARVCHANNVVENAFFSPNGNTLFFVLDAIDTSEAVKVLNEFPDWKHSLSGFIAFTNNVGMYSHTSYAVSGITTGRYSKTRNYADSSYPVSAIGEASFLRDYADAGVPVFAYMSGLGTGWMSVSDLEASVRPSSAGGVMRNSVGRMHERSSGRMAWNISEIALFRIIPFFLKGEFLKNRLNCWNGGNGTDFRNESDLFAGLRKAKVDADAKKTLHFHHTCGGHIPFVRDRNGNFLGYSNNSLSGYFEQSAYAMGEAVKFMDHLRSRGLYDPSTIVLLADHGLTFEHFGDVERNAHPFLWVKPPHSDAPFAFSGLPTSHSKISELARTALAEELNPTSVSNALKCEGPRVIWTFGRDSATGLHMYTPHEYDESGNLIAN